MESLGKHAPLEQQVRYKIAKSLLEGESNDSIMQKLEVPLDYICEVKSKILQKFVVFEDKNIQRPAPVVERELFDAIAKEKHAKTVVEQKQWCSVVDALAFEYVYCS